MRNVATVVLVLAVAVGGCSFGFMRDRPEPIMETAEQTPYLEKAAVVESTQSTTPTAIENALEWSQKYARAVEDLSRQQEANRNLADEKRQLNEQIAAAQAELARAHKELQEANDLLIVVRQENERWKADVLGHRAEILLAHKTEMDALVKVLRLLGGEFVQPAPKPQAQPATTSTNTSASSTLAPTSGNSKTSEETKGAAGETAG